MERVLKGGWWIGMACIICCLCIDDALPSARKCVGRSLNTDFYLSFYAEVYGIWHLCAK